MRILLLALLFSSTGQAQSFGDDFMRWVKHDANRQSREMTEAHWQTYWTNYYSVLHDQISQRAEAADSQLDWMARINDSLVSRLDTASIEQFIALKKNANLQLMALYMISGEIESLSHAMNPQLKPYPLYLQEGFYHFGTTTLMESYSALKNGTDDIATSYSVSFTQETGGDGEGVNPGLSSYGSAYDAKNDVEKAVLTTGIALTQVQAGPYTAKVQMAGWMMLAVYAIYKYWGVHEFNRQIDKLKDAFELLPKKMLTTGETYAIYQSNYRSAAAVYDSLNQVRRQTFQKMDTVCRSLLAFNFQMISMANKILNAQKIEVLAKRYAANPAPYQQLFDQRLVLKAMDEVYQCSKEIRQIQLKAVQAPGKLKKLSVTEELTDALLEYSAIIQTMQASPELVPVLPELKKVGDYFSALQQRLGGNMPITGDAETLDALISSLEQKIVFQKSRTSLPDSLTTCSIESSNKKMIATGYDLPGYAYLHLEGRFGSGSYYLGDNLGPNAYGNNFNSGGRRFEYSPDDGGFNNGGRGFEHSPYDGFNNGGRGFEHSPYDGGYRYDSRNPSAEADKMKDNVETRIRDLRTAHNEIVNLRPQWMAANMVATAKQNTRLLQYEDRLRNARVRNENLNAAYSQQYDQAVHDFTQFPVSAERLQEFFNRNEMTARAAAAVPATNIRPNGYTPSLMDLRSLVYSQPSATEKDIMYEAGKMGAGFDRVWKRMQENEAAHKPDPVFENKDAFARTVSLAKSYLLTASNITKPGNSFYTNNPQAAKKTAAAFIENARMLRFYGEGLLPEYVLNESNFYVNYPKIRTVMKENVDKYYSSCDPNLSLEQSDCNKFTAYYLKDVYGVGDFYNNPKGQDAVTNNGASIPVLNSTQMTGYAERHWTRLGDAGDQLTLDMAGLYAGMGFAVIAVAPGHVCIILPTDPAKYVSSGQWNARVPQILNFAQVGHLQDLNIKLDVPLSYGFGNPAGVRIYVKPQVKDY